MHTSCQSCRFWLQTGRWALLQCCCNTFVSRGYLQCSQVGWGEQSACLFQGEIGDWCCLVGMLLVMWSLEMLPCSSALLFFSSFCQIGPPLYTLKPLFLFSFFSSSSEIIQSFFFSLFLTCFLPSPHCFVLLNSSHSFCFQQLLCFESSLVSFGASVLIRACINGHSHASICVLAVCKPSPTSLPRSS